MRKKLKQPSFAAGVHRDEVYRGRRGARRRSRRAHRVRDRRAAADRGRELGLRTPSRRLAGADASGPPAPGAATRHERVRRGVERRPSLVQNPTDARTQPRPGRSRTTTPCSASRATVSAASPVGRKETSVAWPGSVTTSTRSGEELAAALGHLARRARTAPPRPPRRTRARRADPRAPARGSSRCSKRAAPSARDEGAVVLVALLREVRGKRDGEPLEPLRTHVERPGSVRAEQPLLAGDRVEVAAERGHVDRRSRRPTARRRRAREPPARRARSTGSTCPVVQATCESAISRVLRADLGLDRLERLGGRALADRARRGRARRTRRALRGGRSARRRS